MVYALLRLVGLAGFCAVLCCPALAGCSEPALHAEYGLELPVLPALWAEALGRCAWRLVWVDGDGRRVQADADGGALPRVHVLEAAATPVIAYPYWLERGIAPGTMKPCGAIYPLDARGGAIRLSWERGVDAVFYAELSRWGGSQRQPHYFDWKRFRELFTERKLDERVCDDPWIVDWREMAIKTAASGFNSRSVVPRTTVDCSVEIPEDGPWVGVSPFAGAFLWEKDAKAVLALNDAVDSFFCPKGTLRCTKGAWVFECYPGPP